MVTISEQKNVEETYADDSIQLRRLMSSGIIGLTNGLTYTPSESNTSSVTPNYLNFPTAGISNGNSSAFYGITNFTAYNPYIHHITVGGDGGAGNIAGALGGAGISNFSPSAGDVTRVNVMDNIVLASNRFEIYSRQFR
jgi:hypothetical protein